MTRKRFIKLVMSYGVQRNEATALASLVSGYGSYEHLMAAMSISFAIKKAIKTIQSHISNIIRQLVPVLESIVNQVVESFK